MAILYELRKVYHHTFHTNNKKRIMHRREPKLKITDKDLQITRKQNNDNNKLALRSLKCSQRNQEKK